MKAGFWRRFRKHQKSNRTLRYRLLSFLNCPKNVVAVAPPNRLAPKVGEQRKKAISTKAAYRK